MVRFLDQQKLTHTHTHTHTYIHIYIYRERDRERERERDTHTHTHTHTMFNQDIIMYCFSQAHIKHLRHFNNPL